MKTEGVILSSVYEIESSLSFSIVTKKLKRAVKPLNTDGRNMQTPFAQLQEN